MCKRDKDCQDCKALSSARDYIRTLEDNERCYKKRLTWWGKRVEEKNDYIRVLEQEQHYLQEKVIQKEKDIFQLFTRCYKLEIRVEKQQDCITDLTVEVDRLDKYIVDMRNENEEEY